MRRPPLISLAVVLTLCGTSPARPDDAQTPRDLQLPSSLHACRAGAYLVDQDIAGVAVRKGPGTASAAIAMLPALRMKQGGGGLELYGAEVKVVGADGRGWFLIEGAEYDPEDDADGPPRKVRTFGETGRVYKGRGWVHGSRLGTEIVASRGLRSGPDRSAGTVHPLALSDADAEVDATFLDCRGAALRLRARDRGKTIEGWINPEIDGEKLCSSQRTTCS